MHTAVSDKLYLLKLYKILLVEFIVLNFNCLGPKHNTAPGPQIHNNIGLHY